MPCNILPAGRLRSRLPLCHQSRVPILCIDNLIAQQRFPVLDLVEESRSSEVLDLVILLRDVKISGVRRRSYRIKSVSRSTQLTPGRLKTGDLILPPLFPKCRWTLTLIQYAPSASMKLKVFPVVLLTMVPPSSPKEKFQPPFTYFRTLRIGTSTFMFWKTMGNAMPSS